MKATIEIPDDLYRQVKARSALQGQTIREVTERLLPGLAFGRRVERHGWWATGWLNGYSTASRRTYRGRPRARSWRKAAIAWGPRVFTVDANVWVAALDPSDPKHDDRLRFLQVAPPDRGTSLLGPALLLVETARALARRRNNPNAGLSAAKTLRELQVRGLYPS